MECYRPVHMGPLFMCDESTTRARLWHTTPSEPAEGTLLTPCVSVRVCVIRLYVSKLACVCV